MRKVKDTPPRPSYPSCSLATQRITRIAKKISRQHVKIVYRRNTTTLYNAIYISRTRAKYINGIMRNELNIICLGVQQPGQMKYLGAYPYDLGISVVILQRFHTQTYRLDYVYVYQWEISRILK